LCRSLREGRRHHPAGSAPGRPEVHDHGQLAAADVAPEGFGVELDRLACEERLAASAAARPF